MRKNHCDEDVVRITKVRNKIGGGERGSRFFMVRYFKAGVAAEFLLQVFFDGVVYL